MGPFCSKSNSVTKLFLQCSPHPKVLSYPSAKSLHTGREKSLLSQAAPAFPHPPGATSPSSYSQPPCSSLSSLFPTLNCKLHLKPTQMFLNAPKGGSVNSFSCDVWNSLLFLGEKIPGRGAAATQLIQISPHKTDKVLCKAQLQAKLSSA